MHNRQLVLKKRPEGYPQADDFELTESQMPEAPADGLLVRNRFLSIDPAMRGWVTDLNNYLPAVALGEVMRSLGVGEVIVSNHSGYKVGDKVTGWLGWQEYTAIQPDKVIRKLGDDDVSESASLGILGLNGITAHQALNRIGQPEAGETIIVSTAAGAVGSIVGQLARLKGCNVIGLTGSDAKVDQCISHFGYDRAINYKACYSHLEQEIKQQCPEGVDIFFDNTAGPISDAVYPRLNLNARVIQCGTSSIANWDPLPGGPRRERYFITRRILQQGFVVFDHMPLWPDVIRELSTLIRAGKLHYSEDIRHGLLQAPQALEELYLGTNQGKTIIQLDQ